MRKGANRAIQKIRKSKGFTILEVLIVVALLGILVAAGSSRLNNSNASESYILQDDISSLSAGAVKWARGRQYTGISVTVLCADGYVEGLVCGAAADGVGGNPWGGDYTIAVNGANANRFDITSTVVPINVGPGTARNYADYARAAQYSAADETLTIVFGS